MERADKSLQDALTHDHLADSASIVKVATDLARSVAHVHEKRLVHCDIKVLCLMERNGVNFNGSVKFDVHSRDIFCVYKC
eukprot:scaffold90082_cov32-Prasinocladus_malaysianus.AAC.1